MSTMAETRLRGTPVAPGVAFGRACFFRCRAPQVPAVTLEPPAQPIAVPVVDHRRAEAPAADPAFESERLQQALAQVHTQLEQLAHDTEARLGPEPAAIVQAHGMMVASPSLRRDLRALIEQGLTAETAVGRYFERQRARLLQADSEVLRQRAADLDEIARDLLDRLRGGEPFLQCRDLARCRVGSCPLRNDHILVADELTLGLTLRMDEHTVGFLASRAGPDSHAAILARTLGVPLVAGIADPTGSIPISAPILLDGDRGEVILHPTRATRDAYRDRLTSRQHSAKAVPPVPGLEVHSNVDNLAGVHAALRAEAEGIGLYRSEMEALAAGRLLSEEEQAASYRQACDAIGERPVHIRLLDLGADKAADWLQLPAEDNPALGCRGLRLLLQRPELLRAQARALATAAARHPIHVVYPMVIDLDQFLQARALFDAAIADLPPARLLHGVLFEVPSACLQAAVILQRCDFGCIGTNDLIQYLFAEDRGRSDAADLALLQHPALWNLIGDIGRTARRLGKRLSICGECAAHPEMLDKVRGAGINTVSTSPPYIGQVRRAFLDNRSQHDTTDSNPDPV